MGGKVFSKNLPFAPFAPCSKLGEIRSSFGRQGTLGKLFLPCFCPLRPVCPRCCCFIDDLYTSEQPAGNELLCDYSECRRSCQGWRFAPDPPPDDGVAVSAGAGASRSAPTGVRLLGGGFRFASCLALGLTPSSSRRVGRTEAPSRRWPGDARRSRGHQRSSRPRCGSWAGSRKLCRGR